MMNAERLAAIKRRLADVAVHTYNGGELLGVESWYLEDVGGLIGEIELLHQRQSEMESALAEFLERKLLGEEPGAEAQR